MLIASQRTELENGARNCKKRSSGYDNSQASNDSELELSCCKKEPFVGCINRTNLSLWGTWNKLFMALPVPQLSTVCTLHGIHPQNAGTGERCSGERSHWGRADWSRQVSLTQSTAPHSGSKSWGILPGQGSRLQESIAQLWQRKQTRRWGRRGSTYVSTSKEAAGAAELLPDWGRDLLM